MRSMSPKPEALVYELSGQLFSGHTLKHSTAALAWPVIAAIGARSKCRQNAAGFATSDRSYQ
jgi:hypothetical protein